MMARNSFSIPDKKIYLKKTNLFKKKKYTKIYPD